MSDPVPYSFAQHSAKPPIEPSPYPNWAILRWLFFLRLFIALSLISAFAIRGALPDDVGNNGTLIWIVLPIYALTLLLSAIALLRQRPRPEHQLQLTIAVDIIVFTLVMHAAGGVDSGLGLLLAIAVATGALLMEGRLSLFFASMAALAVIVEETFTQIHHDVASPNYTQAGLLGITFFTVALLAQILYRRIRAAEWLAARRNVDIADLSKLNAFIIQSMSTGVLIVDGERQLQMLNHAATQLLGKDMAHPGAPLAAAAPRLAAWLDASVKTSIKASQRPATTIHVGNRELRPTLQWLGEQRASGVVIFLEDQQELTKEAQQIKLASLGTLTASIAHNIRNPLSAISHAAQLLAESPQLSDDDRHLLAIVRRNGERIEEIIQSILQLSRRNQAEPEPIELIPWLNQLCDDFRASHGIGPETISLQPPHETNPIVTADPRHLSQILSNLCENALKHGEYKDRPPSIELRIERNAKLIFLEVLDSGPGIDPEKAQEIFNPFYTTSASGTGLGLYIARELAETNGALLEYIARQPQGCCFRLTFQT